VLSPDEAARLITATTCLKHRAALSMAYGAGLRVAEVASLKVSDIDSERMLIHVVRGKGGRSRHALLPGSMDGLALAHHAALNWPWISFLIASGRAKPEDAELPARSRFVAKPYSHDHVISYVRAML